MKKFQGKKGMIILIFMVALVVGYYYYLSNKTEKMKAEENPVTKVQIALLRNLDYDYPPTPKEVVKYYSELTMCFYNETYEEADLNSLAKKALQLYDEELVEYNEWTDYITRLEDEIKLFKSADKSILEFRMPSSTDVDFFEQDERQWARVNGTFSIKMGKDYFSLNEVFLLRKDEDGHWKIYGWDLRENVNLQKEAE